MLLPAGMSRGQQHSRRRALAYSRTHVFTLSRIRRFRRCVARRHPRISIPRRQARFLGSPDSGIPPLRADGRRGMVQYTPRRRGDKMELNASVTAVITGGASGLGEATARALAAHGVRVALFDMN